jgi:drug/metabolite transporter (DMT)-like permease
VIVGLVAALAAAACYGFGSILQSIAAAESTVTERLDVAGLARLVAQWRYVCGLALDLVGFLAAVVALRDLPLFVVQAAVASSVGVTALAARLMLQAQFSRRERWALASLLAGLVLLGIAGRPEHATHFAEPGPALLLAGAAVLAVATLLTRSSGAFLAAGAGVSFGAVGIAARAFEVPHQWVHAFGDPLLYALAAYGLLATLLYAGALQRSPVTTVAAITFSVETVVPALVGLAVLGDHARSGMAPVAAVGFTLTVLASIALARYAEPAEAVHAESADRQQ